MSKHKGRRDFAAHTTAGWPDNLARHEDQKQSPTQAGSFMGLMRPGLEFSGIAGVSVDSGDKVEITATYMPPFHAEEQTLSPSNGVPSIVKLNEYLNAYRASHPDAALLQMIPTAPNTYLFVWEA